jgi:hypothetical protein
VSRPDTHLEVAARVDPDATPGNVVPALASLLLQRARRSLAERRQAEAAAAQQGAEGRA